MYNLKHNERLMQLIACKLHLNLKPLRANFFWMIRVENSSLVSEFLLVHAEMVKNKIK